MPVFTTIFEDTFDRANENPLNPTNWISNLGVGSNDLQIINDQAVAQFAIGSQVAWYAASLPNDQFAQVTVEARNFVIDGDGALLYVRGTPGEPYSAYVLSATTGPNTNNGHISVANVLVGSATDSSLSGGLAGTGVVTNSGGGGVTDMGLINFKAGSVGNGYSISGNAGVAGATVSWTGTSSGSTTADGSGNFTTGSLANGSYLITPSLVGYVFSPTSQSETISGSNITGVDFTALLDNWYSVPDCRTFPPNFATYRLVNGTKTYDVQTSSNGGIPPDDSREDVPVASGEYPQNSRKPGVYGPGE
jgi:hypothetical protein